MNQCVSRSFQIHLTKPGLTFEGRWGMRCSKRKSTGILDLLQVLRTPGNFQDLEISMAVILRSPWNIPWPMEISRSWKFPGPMEIFMAPGKFHGPWKFPWAALFHPGRAVRVNRWWCEEGEQHVQKFKFASLACTYVSIICTSILPLYGFITLD